MKHKHSRPFVTQKMEKYILVILGRLFLQKVPYKNCCSSFVTSQWCGLLVIRKLITNDDVLIQSCLLWNMQYELISTLLKRIFYKVKYEFKFSNLQARNSRKKIVWHEIQWFSAVWLSWRQDSFLAKKNHFKTASVLTF